MAFIIVASTFVLLAEKLLSAYSSTGSEKLSFLEPAGKLNALNADSHTALKQACSDAEANDDVRVIVIRGASPPPAVEGKRPKPAAFAAGADISEFAGKNSDDVRSFFENNAWEKVWNLSKPTIAMVDGFALGGDFHFEIIEELGSCRCIMQY